MMKLENQWKCKKSFHFQNPKCDKIIIIIISTDLKNLKLHKHCIIKNMNTAFHLTSVKSNEIDKVIKMYIYYNLK